MKKDLPLAAQQWLQRIEKSDPELFKEVTRTCAVTEPNGTTSRANGPGARAPEAAPGPSSPADPAPDLTAGLAPPTWEPRPSRIDRPARPSRADRPARPVGRRRPDETDLAARREEAVVRAGTRPVFLIRDNKFVRATDGGPISVNWANRIEALASLSRRIEAVGRIEFANHPSRLWGGTGWLVRDRIVVTNRHVAKLFARADGREFVFRPGLNPGQSLGVSLDFLEEHDNSRSRDVSIEKVLYIAPDTDVDLALLLIASWGSLEPATPIPLASRSPAEDDFVAAIGYPAPSSDPRETEFVRDIFGNVFNKKRVAPGQIMAPDGRDVVHDCSTLNGNSGSVLINLATGEAVGLHYEGAFMRANYAVSVEDINKGLSGLDGTGPRTDRNTLRTPESVADGRSTASGTIVIPIEIHIKVGQPSGAVGVGDALPPRPVATEPLVAARQLLRDRPDVLGVRMGKRMSKGWVTDEDAIVVEVSEKLSPARLRDANIQAIPEIIAGLPVDVRVASVLTQLRALGVKLPDRAAEAPPGINYREPPGLSLQTVNEEMEAVFHVSPDSGFPQLKDLFSKVTRTLAATMFEWDADHVFAAIKEAVEPNRRKLLMVTQPPKRGARPPLDRYVARLKEALGERFRHTSAAVFAPQNLFDTSYHIKVAVADREWLWLSSGNWKGSGQPDITPAADGATTWGPLLDYNREWHALIRNANLAGQYEDYIEYDYEQSSAARLPEAAPFEWPDLFVPLPDAGRLPEAPRGRPQYFPPLRLSRRLRVTPLLTPDYEDFIDATLALIRVAGRSILVQNQSFNLLEDNKFDKFEEFFAILADQQRRGLDVRIILRDASEFPGNSGDKQDELLDRLARKGFDRERIRLQPGCHTKGIIVDGAKILLGSHNLTNAGTHTNRDASLIVDDNDVARYFREVFEFDWVNLAGQRAPEAPPAIRLAREGEETPPGMIRINASEILDSDFPMPSFFASRR